MTNLTRIDSRHKLAPAPAASYQRARSAGCPAGITSADRTRAEQTVLYADYKAGRGPIASKPGTSKHEFGLALDLPPKAAAWMQAHGAEYGWVRTNSEWWHFEYQPKRDLVAQGLGTFTVRASKLRLRERPSTSSRVIRLLAAGTTVKVTALKKTGGRTWARIPAGYVAAEYLRRKK